MAKVVPIKFKGLDCPACGSKDSIRFIDKSNGAHEHVDDSVQGAYHAICIFCNHRYIPRWDITGKYILEDISKVTSGFVEAYTDIPDRDLVIDMVLQYKLPSESQTEK